MTHNTVCFYRLALLAILAMLAPWHTAWADIRGLPQISVLAASSLTNPLTEIVRDYSRQSNITVTASFDSTSNQARKIQEGESADIIISSHPAWMTDLKQKGLIDVYSLTNLVRNKLALVISNKHHLKNHPVLKQDMISQLTFLNDRMILTMGDPSDTSLGIYSKQALINIGKPEKVKIWDTITNHIIRSGNAKSALYLITHGQGAGIVFHSDTVNNQQVKVLSDIPDSLHEPIIYQAAVVAGEHMSDARGFLRYLQTNQANQIFAKYGLIVD